jgi:hypothetical protein
MHIVSVVALVVIVSFTSIPCLEAQGGKAVLLVLKGPNKGRSDSEWWSSVKHGLEEAIIEGYKVIRRGEPVTSISQCPLIGHSYDNKINIEIGQLPVNSKTNLVVAVFSVKMPVSEERKRDTHEYMPDKDVVAALNAIHFRELMSFYGVGVVKYVELDSVFFTAKTPETTTTQTSEIPTTQTSEIPTTQTSEIPTTQTSEIPTTQTSVSPTSSNPVSVTPKLTVSGFPTEFGSGTDIPSGSGTDIPSGSGTDIPSGSGTDIPSGSGTDVPSGSGTVVPFGSGSGSGSGDTNSGDDLGIFPDYYDYSFPKDNWRYYLHRYWRDYLRRYGRSVAEVPVASVIDQFQSTSLEDILDKILDKSEEVTEKAISKENYRQILKRCFPRYVNKLLKSMIWKEHCTIMHYLSRHTETNMDDVIKALKAEGVTSHDCKLTPPVIPTPGTESTLSEMPSSNTPSKVLDSSRTTSTPQLENITSTAIEVTEKSTDEVSFEKEETKSSSGLKGALYAVIGLVAAATVVLIISLVVFLHKRRRKWSVFDMPVTTTAQLKSDKSVDVKVAMNDYDDMSSIDSCSVGGLQLEWDDTSIDMLPGEEE